MNFLEASISFFVFSNILAVCNILLGPVISGIWYTPLHHSIRWSQASSLLTQFYQKRIETCPQPSLYKSKSYIKTKPQDYTIPKSNLFGVALPDSSRQSKYQDPKPKTPVPSTPKFPNATPITRFLHETSYPLRNWWLHIFCLWGCSQWLANILLCSLSQLACQVETTAS